MRHIRIAACIAGALLIAGSAPAVDWNDPGSVVAAAVAAAPALRELDARVAAARARQRGAGAMPNPMLMAGVQNQPIDFSADPMTMVMVGASQTLVRRERREALQRAAALDVDRLGAEADVLRAEVARDALVAWNEAAAAQNQIVANDEIAKLAALTADAARARYEVGAATQLDIIRAKLESSNVRHDVLMQRGNRDRALARLRALLALPAGEAIPPFTLPPHDMERHVEHVAAAPALPVETPAFAVLDAEIARAEEEIHLARLAAKPDVTLEASYGARPRERDMFSAVARMELPVRKETTIAPRIAEAIAQREEIRVRVDALRQQLRAAFDDALARRSEALEQIDLHVQQLVPGARLGFESALASYQAGKSGFDAALGALQTYRTLNVDYYDFIRQLRVADAELDALRHGARPAAATSVAAMGGSQ